ncbi:hypothetical protein GCM10007984_25660 [Shewanella putrefaciens]|nr:hypothetical protein GCM10007984_25660 [Shewanella putrefaciens]
MLVSPYRLAYKPVSLKHHWTESLGGAGWLRLIYHKPFISSHIDLNANIGILRWFEVDA